MEVGDVGASVGLAVGANIGGHVGEDEGNSIDGAADCDPSLYGVDDGTLVGAVVDWLFLGTWHSKGITTAYKKVPHILILKAMNFSEGGKCRKLPFSSEKTLQNDVFKDKFCFPGR